MQVIVAEKVALYEVLSSEYYCSQGLDFELIQEHWASNSRFGTMASSVHKS
jgi:hypothetical protein